MLATTTPAVIGPAASVIEVDAVRDAMAGHFVVWLTGPVERLAADAAGRSHRPFLDDGDPLELFTRQMATREPLVLPMADLVIDVYSMPKDAQADAIVDAFALTGEASSRQAGAGDLDLGGDEAGVVGDLALVGQEAGGAALEQGGAVGAAEHAGVHTEAVGRRDLLDQAAALLHEHAPLAEGVGAPDAALGVEAAAVGRDAGERRPRSAGG